MPADYPGSGGPALRQAAGLEKSAFLGDRCQLIGLGGERAREASLRAKRALLLTHQAKQGSWPAERSEAHIQSSEARYTTERIEIHNRATRDTQPSKARHSIEQDKTSVSDSKATTLSRHLRMCEHSLHIHRPSDISITQQSHKMKLAVGSGVSGVVGR